MTTQRMFDLSFGQQSAELFLDWLDEVRFECEHGELLVVREAW